MVRRRLLRAATELSALALLLAAAVSLLVVLLGPSAPQPTSTHAAFSAPVVGAFHGTKALAPEIDDDAEDGCDEDEALDGAASSAEDALSASMLGLRSARPGDEAVARAGTGAGRLYSTDLFRPPQA